MLDFNRFYTIIRVIIPDYLYIYVSYTIYVYLGILTIISETYQELHLY